MTAVQLVNRLLEAEDIDWTPDPGDADFEGAQFLSKHPDIRTQGPSREEVTFELEAEPEEEDFRGHFDTGEPEQDAQDARWIEQQLGIGNIWAWCSVKVTAKWTDEAGKEYEGVDYLGGCSYRNRRDFTAEGGFYPQMCDQAYDDLLAQVKHDKFLD